MTRGLSSKLSKSDLFPILFIIFHIYLLTISEIGVKKKEQLMIIVRLCIFIEFCDIITVVAFVERKNAILNQVCSS